MRAWLGLSVIALVAAREAEACSLIVQAPLMLGPRTAMMIAAPTVDSLFAGPGKTKYRLGPGHHGPVYDRPIYGQVMRVDSALGPGARPGSRVVLVPWDYDSMCNEVPWGSSFLWRRPTARGLYTAALRDSVDWAGGLPTYDVFVTEGQPYTDRPGGNGVTVPNPGPVPLTPEELFAVARGFRVVTNAQEAEAATMAMYLWADANPQIAKRSPLDESLNFSGYHRWRIRGVILPNRGTYRVTYTIGQDSVTFYARTDAKPNNFWDGMAYLAPGNIETRLAVDGYFINGWYSSDTLTWDGSRAKSLDWAISREPVVADRRVTTWRGWVDPNMIPDELASPAMKAAIREMRFVLEARFTLGTDGSATFEHRSQLADGRAVVVRGVRIGRAVFQ
jgi:hypothetical protein